MSGRRTPSLADSDARLKLASREVAMRLVHAERNLERALARQQQAEEATARVRRLAERARGDLRLVRAIMDERESFFEEEGGTGGEEVQRENTADCVNTMLRQILAPPGTTSSTGPSSLPCLKREASAVSARSAKRARERPR